MKRVFLALLVGLVAVTSTATTNILPTSVVPLVSSTGDVFCSSFIIDTARKYLLTADHCLAGQPFVNGAPAEEVYHDQSLDVSVLKAPGLISGPALKASPVVEWYDPVTMIGYADGQVPAKKIKSQVLLPVVSVETIPGRWTVYEQVVIPGMSGGPIVRNSDGTVVGIVQLGSDKGKYSISRPIADVYESTKQFWERGVE